MQTKLCMTVNLGQTSLSSMFNETIKHQVTHLFQVLSDADTEQSHEHIMVGLKAGIIFLANYKNTV